MQVTLRKSVLCVAAIVVLAVPLWAQNSIRSVIETRVMPVIRMLRIVVNLPPLRSTLNPSAQQPGLTPHARVTVTYFRIAGLSPYTALNPDNCAPGHKENSHASDFSQISSLRGRHRGSRHSLLGANRHPIHQPVPDHLRHVGDFQAGVKEYNEVLRKAGWDHANTVWVSASGPREYTLASYAPKYAEFDKVMWDDPKLKDYGRQLASISARIDTCIENRDRIIEEVQIGLSIPGKDNPALLRVLRTVVKPDRVDEFMALLKNELLPAVQNSELKLYHVSRTRYGGPTTEFRFMAGWDKWADSDGTPPIKKAMGDEKYAQFQRKWASMIVESQADVYRFQPDLSYLPVSPVTSTR